MTSSIVNWTIDRIWAANFQRNWRTFRRKKSINLLKRQVQITRLQMETIWTFSAAIEKVAEPLNSLIVKKWNNTWMKCAFVEDNFLIIIRICFFGVLFCVLFLVLRCEILPFPANKRSLLTVLRTVIFYADIPKMCSTKSHGVSSYLSVYNKRSSWKVIGSSVVLNGTLCCH